MGGWAASLRLSTASTKCHPSMEAAKKSWQTYRFVKQSRHTQNTPSCKQEMNRGESIFVRESRFLEISIESMGWYFQARQLARLHPLSTTMYCSSLDGSIVAPL